MPSMRRASSPESATAAFGGEQPSGRGVFKRAGRQVDLDPLRLGFDADAVQPLKQSVNLRPQIGSSRYRCLPPCLRPFVHDGENHYAIHFNEGEIDPQLFLVDSVSLHGKTPFFYLRVKLRVR